MLPETGDGTWEDCPWRVWAAAGAGRRGRAVGHAGTQSQSEGRWCPGSREETRAGGGRIYEMGGERAAAGSEEAAPGSASRQAPGGSARDSETQCSFLTKYSEPYRAKADQAGDRPTARWEGRRELWSGKDSDRRPPEASARREGKASVWG